MASCPPATPPQLLHLSFFLMKCECPFGSGTKGVRGGEKSRGRNSGPEKRSSGVGVGVLETLCFYPTVKLFVLNEAKKTLNGFPSGDRNMFVYVSVWREKKGERQRARESMHRKDWGFVQVKTSHEDGFNLPMLCLHVYNVKEDKSTFIPIGNYLLCNFVLYCSRQLSQSWLLRVYWCYASEINTQNSANVLNKASLKSVFGFLQQSTFFCASRLTLVCSSILSVLIM